MATPYSSSPISAGQVGILFVQLNANVSGCAMSCSLCSNLVSTKSGNTTLSLVHHLITKQCEHKMKLKSLWPHSFVLRDYAILSVYLIHSKKLKVPID